MSGSLTFVVSIDTIGRMWRAAAIGALTLVAVATSGAATKPSNYGVQILTPFDDASGEVILGQVDVGKVFVLPMFVATYKNPTDDEDSPIDTTTARSATYAVDVPSGLVVQPSAPVRGGGFIGNSVTCVSACVADIPAGRLGVNAVYRLVASSAGTFTVRIRLTSVDRPDPETTNDQASSDIRAAAATGGQGGAVAAGTSVTAPKLPLAGRPYALTLPLTKAGTPVKPTSVRCAATLRGRALKATAAKLSGRARCTWKLPSTTRGAQLKAKLTAVAGGKTFTASRTARVR